MPRAQRTGFTWASRLVAVAFQPPPATASDRRLLGLTTRLVRRLQLHRVPQEPSQACTEHPAACPGLAALCGAAPAMEQPLVASVAPGGSCFAAVTVAGIVPADPDLLFKVFSDPARTGKGVFSDVKACKELGRSKLRLSGQHLTDSVEVEQVARVNVLRMPVDAAMTVRLDCNHTQRQVKLHLVKSHSLLVRKYEGTYTVIPWGEGQHPATLPEGLADTLGPDVWRQLHSKLADAAAASSTAARGAGSSSSSSSRQRKGAAPGVGQQLGQQPGKGAGRRQRHSLVILHQRLQPGVRPPPGLGGYVRGQVRRQFERMFGDLHRASTQIVAPQPTLQGLGSWLRSFPLLDMSL
ncbi:transcriptional family [Chlorella sorokiniana]|uniref:Transcriptional family n=1 Tax=Chlorella sorokiniana TaxID=3076 RepID=A0A2P6TRG3_CHLSO|nr:transcriptional family [Chlorella sorokiniana]|eukprot:PRW56654.1 transcriptional family [Chlorella sorokiniana]